MKRLLITGASGDLGRPLCELAVSAGYEVWAAYSSRPERIAVGQAIHVDLNSRAAVEGLLERVQPDVVIHTAVPAGVPDQREQIVNWATYLHELTRSAARLITLSSDMVFDGTRAPYHDDDPPSPISSYGQAKAETESMGDCVVRTSLIYDFDRGNKQVDWMLDAITKGERRRLFYDEFRSPIWARNLGAALVELVECPVGGILNIAGTQSMSRLELGRALLESLGHNPHDHIEAVSQAGTGRPPNLTLDVNKAKSILNTRLLTFAEARSASSMV